MKSKPKMKISEIKTYYEILEFIETTCDEAQEATRFSYKNTYMCKVPCTSGPLARAMGMDYTGNMHQIGPDEVVEKDV